MQNQLNSLQPATLTTLEDDSRYRSMIQNNYTTNYATKYTNEYSATSTDMQQTQYLTTSDFYRPLSRISTRSIETTASPNQHSSDQSIKNADLSEGHVFMISDPDQEQLIGSNRSQVYEINTQTEQFERGKRILARICGHFVSFIMLLMMCAFFAVLIRSFRSGVSTGFHRHGRFMYPIG